MNAPSQWPQWLTTPKHVAQALNWIRWRTQGTALLLIALGVNTIAISTDPQLDAEDAIALLEVEQETIAQLLRRLKEQRNVYGSIRRPQSPP